MTDDVPEEVLRIDGRIEAVTAQGRRATLAITSDLTPVIERLVRDIGSRCMVGLIITQSAKGGATQGLSRSEQG